MCYSAEVWADYRKFKKRFGADVDIREFVRLYFKRWEDPKSVRVPKAMDAAFLGPQGDPAAQEIVGRIRAYDAREAEELQAELAKQTERKTTNEQKLATKVTKTAQEEVRKASNKIAAAQRNLADLQRVELEPRDSRIFPMWYAPVMVVEEGKRVVRPMRYLCRLPGKPADSDYVIDRATKQRRMSGVYNARRDNLERYWRPLFAQQHGIMVVSKFYENVERDGKNVVLEFNPQDGREMLVACLWSLWTDPAGAEPDLLSFAAITDEPPPEVAAAGHDRCIIPIKPEHVEAWLNPGGDVAAMQAILNDRERPFYEHRLAA